MQQLKFSYDSFFNTLEKRKENKNKSNFMNMLKTEVINTDDYEIINKELCFNPEI